MQLSVRSNIQDVRRTLSRMQREQVPFAASQAINDVAFSIRIEAIKLWAQSVVVKNSGFMRAAMVVKRSNKRDLTAVVYDRLGRKSLERQIHGARVYPLKTAHLKVPTRNMLTKSGRISRRKLRETFIGDPLGKGRIGLWERTKAGGLKLLYNLEPDVDIAKHFPFYEMAERIGRREFSVAFDRRMRMALATAR